MNNEELRRAESYHIEAIRRIQEEAQLRAKPHVDALVRLRSLSPPPPQIITLEEAERLRLKVRSALRARTEEQANEQ